MSKVKKRWVVRTLILGVWVAMLAVLVQRVRGGRDVAEIASSPPASGAAAASEPVEDWMVVTQEGRRIGFTHRTLATAASEVTLFEETQLRLKVLDAERTVRTLVHATLDPAYQLQKADFALQSEATSFAAVAEAKGKILAVRLDFGSTQSEYTLPLDAPIFLPQSLRASLHGAMLADGRQVRAAVWDPLTSSSEEIVVKVVGREPVPGRQPMEAGWRVEEELRGMKTTAWVNDDGDVLREEGPLGLVLERATRDIALAEIAPGTAVDLARQASIAVGRIEAPRSRTRLRLRLQGMLMTSVPSDNEQAVRGDVLTIDRKHLARRETYVLPDRGGHEPDLQPTVFLQSGHPRVVALAKEIIGQEVDAQRVARMLNDWVYEYVEKTPTISVPNALEVIDSGRGDCNEHAVLLAALGRAVGLPTRVVAGLVYVDDAFLYHAWCEVWLGRWVSIDPALHQFPTDATHVKLIEGGPEKHAALLSIVGKLKIEVLDAGG